MNSLIEKCFKQGFRDIFSVDGQFSKKFFCEELQCFRIAVVNIPRCQTKKEQFSFVVVDKVQFEAVKPTHRVFSAFVNVLEHPVSINAFVVAHSYFCAVDKGNSGTFAETDGIQKEHHRYENTTFDLHKTIVMAISYMQSAMLTEYFRILI